MTSSLGHSANSKVSDRPSAEAGAADGRHPGRAKQLILQALRKHQTLSAGRLAEALSVSVQAVRRHLKDLETEGAIVHESVRAGTGRPQHVYRLTAKGLEQFPKHYDEFAVTFLMAMADRVGSEQVEQVLHQQWQQKAMEYRRQIGEGPLGDRIAALAELRSQEGYMVDWSRLETEEGDRYVFTEYNCAISQVAETFPSVCGHELEMLQTVFSDGSVERTHWMVGDEHRCGYLIAS
ncbi:iron-sulfur cluster biosynthesis transcriptional regulator SufR [Synechococcus sp. PCC 7336]|uniref:iron-sulfur cluster biosynthesis transcriptional regulator SufR n=1 Tax=Synechococcus sp. PCC 7336 TaxID=195250 RepID=UPI00037A781A|nr:iron-sulfur cluster biosynthesis transcriptional regulator SufR [Synechococcus sp. PCC 7336]